MAGEYKALRVPIALLHQKVYSTSQRLEKWQGFVHEEKKPEVKSSLEGVVTLNLFETTPYLRKFFVLEDEIERVSCRFCGEVCKDRVDRAEHVICIQSIRAILDRLVRAKKCVICEAPLVVKKILDDLWEVPVCSEDCMYVWDRYSPAPFNAELSRMQLEQVER